ncbi:hypothetical protein ACROYT_G028061 [Oculina patagonica]
MDKDPGENYLPKQVTIKSAAMKKKWRHFIDNSTLHGMQYVFNGETKIRTIIWTVVLLAGTAYFTYQSSVLLKRYYSYPITTKITLKYEEVAEFPAITICHFNKLRKTFVDKHNAEEVLKYALTGALGTKINSSTIGWTGLRNFSMEDILKIGGHQIEKMMKTCLWRGKKCDERNFTKILTPMGLCHTFNSDEEGREILRVRNAGSKFGLNLVLDVQQDEYTTSLLADQAGFMVLIHDQETPPMVEELGFSIGPGTTTFAAFTKHKVVNLEAPYETNCSASSISNIPGYSKYTTSSCMLACQSKYIMESCRCRDVTLPETFYKFKADDCDCKVPCETTSYKPSLSYGAFPSYSVAFDEARKNASLNSSEENWRKIGDALHEKYSENRVELNVYFQQMYYELIEQQPAYDKESVMGEIGGQLGLCIGASLLTVVEFCDLIVSILKIRFGHAELSGRQIKRRKALKKKRKDVLQRV